MATPAGFEHKVGFIWRIADKLRGNLRPHEYGQVMLPTLVLFRLDAVLEPTKQAVIAKAEQLRDSTSPGNDKILRRVAKQSFYNVCPLTMKTMLSDDKNIAAQLRQYIAGFSPGAAEVLEEFRYDDKITRLDKAGILYAVPQISDAVLLTHLRTEARGQEENLALTVGSDEPGVALPGGVLGQLVDPPYSKLSALIATLNEKFGMNLTEADKVWFEQQKQAVKDDPDVRVVALNNDRDQYRVVLEKVAEDAILDRHESNGELFAAFFDKPGFREALLEYLASSYDEIRGEDASPA